VEKYCRVGQATDDNMARARCMLDTHSGCVILIAFPLQQWLHECASMFVIRTLLLLLQKFRAKFKLQL
jgi:hypothetical protein